MSALTTATNATATATYRQARDLLQQHRLDYSHASAAFQWPTLSEFNWALDFFDQEAQGNTRPVRQE